MLYVHKILWKYYTATTIYIKIIYTIRIKIFIVMISTLWFKGFDQIYICN